MDYGLSTWISLFELRIARIRREIGEGLIRDQRGCVRRFASIGLSRNCSSLRYEYRI